MQQGMFAQFMSMRHFVVAFLFVIVQKYFFVLSLLEFIKGRPRI